MIPFASSLKVYRAGGNPETPAFGSVSRKDLARTKIAGDLRLSVPIEGGASALRYGGDVKISDHGRWRDVHLGAWRAAYGRTPWFPYLFPEIEEVYREHSYGTLEEFNRSLDEIVKSWTGNGEDFRRAREMKEKEPERFAEITRSLSENISRDLSIFDALFRLGKDTLFLLI